MDPSPCKEVAVEVEASTPGSCAICSTPSHQQCVRCQNVFYCSKSHQKQDWKVHKHSCHAVKIVEVQGQGHTPSKTTRTLISTRDIARGEVIFKEAPLLTGPRVEADKDGFFSGSSTKFPLCLDCYRPVGGTYRCSSCFWPLCGPSCENVSKKT